MEETTGWVKCRTVLGIMGFLGFAIVYAMRVNLSVAIVAMVNSTTPQPSNDSSLDVCEANPVSNTTKPTVSYYILFLLMHCWLYHIAPNFMVIL